MSSEPSKIVFGTDGWRGIIDVDVTNKSIAVIAQAFADHLLESVHKIISPSVVIGFDGRRNSKQYAALFARVLAGNRIRVVVSDRVVPTPVLSWSVKTGGYNAGVMITASHNPSKYSGVKFKGEYGGPFLTQDTKKVESRIEYNLIQTADSYSERNLVSDYITSITEKIDFKSARKKGLRILVDSMGGAGGRLIEEILSKQKIETVTIHGEPDTDFYGRSPEPVDKNLAPLKEEIVKGNFAFGIATDGDADRVAFVLDNGEWLSAQETILLLTDHLVNSGLYDGDIVKTVSVTDKLFKLKLGNRKIREVQVGFKYITGEMLSGGVAMGFEESGGFGLTSHIPERDGLLFAMIMLEMLGDSPFTTLSELVSEKRKEFGAIHYDRIDHHYEEDDRMELLPHLFAAIPEEVAGFKVTGSSEFYSANGVVNGLKLRLDGESRWLLIRSSETEPLLRFYAEGESEDEPASILEAGMKLLIEKRNSG